MSGKLPSMLKVKVTEKPFAIDPPVIVFLSTNPPTVRM